ncbi:MAG: hypothetical protein WA634_15970 [Silvibacterium sp.]
MAVYLTNSFEFGGTHQGSGANITAGNSGGGNDNAFDVVTNSTSNTTTYSNTVAHSGTYSMAMTLGSTAGIDYVQWSTSLTGSSLAQAWFRAYINCNGAYPAANIRVASFYDGATVAGGITLLATSGKVESFDTAGTVAPVSTNPVNLSGWTRLEGYVKASLTAGSISYSIYLTPDSATPTETETTATNLATSSGITLIRLGNALSGATSYTYYLDDIGVSDTGYLGPSLYTGTGTGALTLAATSTGSKPSGVKARGFPAVIPVLEAADLI